MSAPDSGLQLVDVSAGYTQRPVLRHITLEVDPGECVALLGPNGVGKTTLIRTITGQLQPTSGSITWNGHSLVGVPTHRIGGHGVTCVAEGHQIFPGMTVEENLKVGGHTLPAREVLNRVHEVYDVIPFLRERRRHIAGRMSGGQQQLCAIGRALVMRPRLLLLDELSLGLSPIACQQVVDVLVAARAVFQPAIVLVDQTITIPEAMATRGYFLHQGEVVAAGEMHELLNASVIRDLYFASRGDRKQRQKTQHRSQSKDAAGRVPSHGRAQDPAR